MSGVTHVFFGFGLGLIILYLTNNRFDLRRVIILGTNSYIGPDLQVLIYGFFKLFLPDETAKVIALVMVHSAYGWPIFSFLLALIYYFFSHYKLQAKKFRLGMVKLKEPALSYFNCYKLILAGGLLHFQLDWLFHPNTPEYTAIMATGNFELPFQPWTEPPAHWSILVTGIMMLSFGYFILWIFAKNNWNEKEKFINSVRLFIGYAILYLVWLGSWILATGEPLPVGEESDFGQIIFYSVTFFMPLILVATSIEKPEFMRNEPPKISP